MGYCITPRFYIVLYDWFRCQTSWTAYEVTRVNDLKTRLMLTSSRERMIYIHLWMAEVLQFMNNPSDYLGLRCNSTVPSHKLKYMDNLWDYTSYQRWRVDTLLKSEGQSVDKVPLTLKQCDSNTSPSCELHVTTNTLYPNGGVRETSEGFEIWKLDNSSVVVVVEVVVNTRHGPLVERPNSTLDSRHGNRFQFRNMVAYRYGR